MLRTTNSLTVLNKLFMEWEETSATKLGLECRKRVTVSKTLHGKVFCGSEKTTKETYSPNSGNRPLSLTSNSLL